HERRGRPFRVHDRLRPARRDEDEDVAGAIPRDRPPDRDPRRRARDEVELVEGPAALLLRDGERGGRLAVEEPDAQRLRASGETREGMDRPRLEVPPREGAPAVDRDARAGGSHDAPRGPGLADAVRGPDAA